MRTPLLSVVFVLIMVSNALAQIQVNPTKRGLYLDLNQASQALDFTENLLQDAVNADNDVLLVINPSSWQKLSEYQSGCPEIYYQYFDTMLELDYVAVSNRDLCIRLLQETIPALRQDIADARQQVQDAFTPEELNAAATVVAALKQNCIGYFGDGVDLKAEALNNKSSAEATNAAILALPPCNG